MLTVQPFTFNPVQENTYVLYNDKGECCIIDPGCYFASEEQALTSFIAENKLKPVLLLNTHCHLDHIFGNRFVSTSWGLSLHLNKLEKAVLDYGPASGQLWQLPFDNYDGELNFIDEGDVIRIGDDELRRGVQRRHKSRARAVDVERAGVDCAEPMLDHYRRGR